MCSLGSLVAVSAISSTRFQVAGIYVRLFECCSASARSLAEAAFTSGRAPAGTGPTPGRPLAVSAIRTVPVFTMLPGSWSRPEGFSLTWRRCQPEWAKPAASVGPGPRGPFSPARPGSPGREPEGRHLKCPRRAPWLSRGCSKAEAAATLGRPGFGSSSQSLADAALAL
jgi:hypothetical protein